MAAKVDHDFFQGLALEPFFAALMQVEVNLGANPKNIYSISQSYVGEVNRYLESIGARDRKGRIMGYTLEDRANPQKAEEIIIWRLMSKFKGYKRETGKPATYEVMAKIHIGGSKGWKNQATEPYWEMVKAELERNAVSRDEAVDQLPGEVEDRTKDVELLPGTKNA